MLKSIREISRQNAKQLRMSQKLQNGCYFVCLIDKHNEVQKILATFLELSDHAHGLAKQYMKTLDYPEYYGSNWRMSFNDSQLLQTVCGADDVFRAEVEANKRRAKRRNRRGNKCQ